MSRMAFCLKRKRIDYTAEEIEQVYKRESSANPELVHEIMDFDCGCVDFIAEEERAFPGNPEFVNSGYCNTMLKRYFFAGAVFCKGKRILDSCSGLGWGTYILSKYADKVTAFDIEREAVDFCSRSWKAGNTEWKQGSALDLSFLGETLFDTACAMETIEHFTKEDGEKYIAGLSSRLKRNGVLIGSSYFPETREEAERVCSTNPYHLYIFTEKEMSDTLKRHFRKTIIINRWIFIAVK